MRFVFLLNYCSNSRGVTYCYDGTKSGRDVTQDRGWENEIEWSDETSREKKPEFTFPEAILSDEQSTRARYSAN